VLYMLLSELTRCSGLSRKRISLTAGGGKGWKVLREDFT
jgi:hypothetical protein